MSEEVKRYGLAYTPMPLADWETDMSYARWQDYQALLAKYNGVFEWMRDYYLYSSTPEENKKMYEGGLK